MYLIFVKKLKTTQTNIINAAYIPIDALGIPDLLDINGSNAILALNHELVT